ncbi:hypothetical protein ACOMOD_002395 [Enterococcus faecalis]
MALTVQQVQKKSALLQEKHESDIDLIEHRIGKDPYCLLCEQYKKLMKQEQVLLKQERALKKIQKEQEEAIINEDELTEVKLVSAIRKIEKQLFEITIKDGAKYLVYARDIDQVARLLGVAPSQISKHVKVPIKYWESMYIELENGTLTTVSQLITSKRARILSTHAPSMNQNVRHYCFNNIPFEYIIYESSKIEFLEQFVSPYPITPTKKFKTTGCVMIPLPTGAIEVSVGEILVKITEKVIVPIEKEDFKANFSEKENLVWVMH